MRVLFALLVTVNLALFMWGKWYKEPLVSYEIPPPRPDVAPEKLKRLSEPGVSLSVRPPPTPARSTTPVACFRLGPFAAQADVVAAAAKLDSWGIGHERITEFETLAPAYLVYLPPLPSRQAAERKRAELTRQGFKDHALIHDEGMENGISLGIFGVEANARERMRQLKAKGITASLQPVPNVRPVHWLALVASRDDRVGDVPIARFAEESWGSESVSLQPQPCGSAAALSPRAEPPAQLPAE